MSQSTIGALRVVLGLDSAQFTEGMTKAQMGLQKFAGMAKAGALAIGAAMAAAGTATALAMKTIIDQADEMSKASQSLGIPIDELSRLRHAANLAGVEMEPLSKAMQRLARTMVEAGESANGAAAAGFRGLGVSIRGSDGQLRSSIRVLEDVADRFAAMPDGVTKTATAIKLFGRAGADMIPMLNGGAAGLREAYEEADRLGIVLDEQTGKAAEAFNDNLTRLGLVKDGLITKMTAGMLPALESITNALVNSSRNSLAMKAAGEALGWALKALVTVGAAVGAAFVAAAQGIGSAATAAMKFAQGDLRGAAEAWLRGDAAIKATLQSTSQFVMDVWNPPAGDTAFDVAAISLGGMAEAAGGARRQVEQLTEAEREAARAAQELSRDGQRTYDETRTAAERYTARVFELQRQLQAAAIDQDTFNRALRDARDAFEAADPKAQMRQQMADAAREAEADAKDRRLEAEAEAARFAKEQRGLLRENTFNGISDGLRAAADGDLGSYLANRLRDVLFDRLARSLTDILTGGAGKKGGGNIFASIAKALPGFANGGSFKVGGAGGIDSQVAAMRVTPGERVSITKPGQEMGGGVRVSVIPSPYFDVKVESIAAPVAAQAGVQAFSGARQAVPADMARREAYRRS